MLQIRANPCKSAPSNASTEGPSVKAPSPLPVPGPIYRGSLCKSCKSSASTEGPSVKAPTPGLQAASQRIYREPLCRCVGWRGFARICSIYRGPLCKSGKQKIYRGPLCKSRKSRCIYRAPLCKSCKCRINKSVNQSINQSIQLSINQFINQSINPSTQGGVGPRGSQAAPKSPPRGPQGA